MTGWQRPAAAVNCTIAARLSALTLKSVQTANGGKKFGFLADNQVGTVTVTTPPFRYRKGQPSIGNEEFWVKIV